MEMSENIYVNSGKKFNSNNRDNSCEDIYVNEDIAKTYRSKNTKERPVINTAQSRCSTVTAVCLGLTGVLLLAAIIVLSLKFIEERHSYNNLMIERDQLLLKCNNVTTDRDQLLAKYNNLMIEQGQLQKEKDGLQKRITDCRLFRVGDRVRVKVSVNTPKYGWGRASHKSVGVVTALDGENMTVDFPEHESWKAAVSEMELAP
ncbi:hypothetical protein MHYP_G00058420 [Metynnis hypsauchen]